MEQFVPTIWTTIELCVACGGLLLAVIMAHKKKLAKKYKEQLERQEQKKNDEQTSKS